MGERAMPTVQVLSEVRRHERRGVEEDRETPRNKNTGAQDHQKGIRGEEWRGQLTQSAGEQLTERAGVGVGDDDFSCVWDFNRRRCRKNGLCLTPLCLFFIFPFFFISCALFYSS